MGTYTHTDTHTDTHKHKYTDWTHGREVAGLTSAPGIVEKVLGS